jgi:hypothetical protein
MVSTDHDINKEHVAPTSILHDSMGFEAGKTDRYDTVQNFLGARRESIDLNQQVHCIWYSKIHPLFVLKHTTARFP